MASTEQQGDFLSHGGFLVPGFRVGSAEDRVGATGCTVVLCPPEGATFGLAKLGGASGTRQTDSAEPGHVVDRCHALLLTGGSAYGLDATGGVMGYLEERGIGFPTRAARVPIVPTAVIYDLGIGSAQIRPGPELARAACCEAAAGVPIRTGNAGVGCGATVGKLNGMDHAMKGGLGCARTEVRPGLFLGVLAAVNPVGDVLTSPGGPILAGTRTGAMERSLADSLEVMRRRSLGVTSTQSGPENTILVVVATNGRLAREGVRSLARMAGSGMARVVRPAHLSGDGDLVFAVAAGDEEAPVDLLGALAAELVSEAIVGAVRAATSIHGVPAVED